MGRRYRQIVDLRAIPYFDGTGNVMRFLKIAGSIMENLNDEEEKTSWLIAIKTKLDGAAFDIGQDATTSKQLKITLRYRFMPVQTVEEVEAKIANIKFHRNLESIEEYLDRITKPGRTYAEVMQRSHKVTTEAAKSIADFKIIRHFINGLDDPIKTTLRPLDLKTVDDAAFRIRRMVHLEEAEMKSAADYKKYEETPIQHLHNYPNNYQNNNQNFNQNFASSKQF